MSNRLKGKVKLNYEDGLEVCRGVLVIACTLFIRGVSLFDRCSHLTKKEKNTYFNKDQLAKTNAGCALESMDICHLHANLRAFAGLNPGPLHNDLKQVKEIRNAYEHSKHNLEYDKTDFEKRLDELETLCNGILSELITHCISPVEKSFIDEKIRGIGTRFLTLKDTLNDELHQKTEELKNAVTGINQFKTDATVAAALMTKSSATAAAQLTKSSATAATQLTKSSATAATQLTESSATAAALMTESSATAAAQLTESSATAAALMTESSASAASLIQTAFTQLAQMFKNKQKRKRKRKLSKEDYKCTRRVPTKHRTSCESVSLSTHTIGDQSSSSTNSMTFSSSFTCPTHTSNASTSSTDILLECNAREIQISNNETKDGNPSEKNAIMINVMSTGLVPYSDSEESHSETEGPQVHKKSEGSSDLGGIEDERLYDVNQNNEALETHNGDVEIPEHGLDEQNLLEEKLLVEKNTLVQDNDLMRKELAMFHSMLPKMVLSHRRSSRRRRSRHRYSNIRRFYR